VRTAATRLYLHWAAALERVVRRPGLVEDGYVNPEDRVDEPAE